MPTSKPFISIRMDDITKERIVALAKADDRNTANYLLILIKKHLAELDAKQESPFND